MTKKKRTILFLSCLFVFLFFAPSAVLYSQGYRIDFGARRIIQTGGIFLKIHPRSTDVYLDGKLKEKTDFLFDSILIENLLPKKYKIEARKDGFHSWIKTLEVREKTAVEAKNIILFPRDPEFSIVPATENIPPIPNQQATSSAFNLENGILHRFNNETQSLDKFFEPAKGFEFSPDLKKMVYFSNNEIWVMFLERNDEFQKETGEKVFLIRLSENISDCRWLNDDYLVFLANNIVKILEIDNRDRLNMVDFFELKNLPEFQGESKIFPAQNRIYIFNNETLYSSPKLF